MEDELYGDIERGSDPGAGHHWRFGLGLFRMANGFASVIRYTAASRTLHGPFYELGIQLLFAKLRCLNRSFRDVMAS